MPLLQTAEETNGRKSNEQLTRKRGNNNNNKTTATAIEIGNSQYIHVSRLTRMHIALAQINMRFSGASSSLRNSFHAGSVGAGVSSFGPIMFNT